jgi:NADH:ubiquinone oxidoreductase subunit E
MEVSMAIKPEVRKGVEAICAEYSKEPSPLMMILSKIQKEYGYIPLEVQEDRFG